MDNDQDSDLLRDPWSGMGPDLLAELGVAAASSGLSGPSAFLAVLTPIIKRNIELIQAESRVRATRSGRIWFHASKASGRKALDLIEAADADDDRRHMAFTAGEAAAASRYPARIRALGKALAQGILADDDTVLDYEQQVIDALASIERPHLAILQAMVPEEDIGGGLSVTSRLTYTWQGLKERGPAYRPALHRLLATLEREGLVQVENATHPGGTLPSWQPSDFGVDVLLRLTTVGNEADNMENRDA